MTDLLMRRREMVVEEEELSYITDGLVFHLDGIDKGETQGAWTDLVSGTVFEGTAESQSNCFFFNNTYLSNRSFSLGANSNYTVEICYKETVKQNGVLFCSGNSATGNIFMAPYFKMYLQRGKNYYINRDIGTKYSLSMNNERCIQNLVAKRYDGVASSYTTSETNIGCRYYKGYNVFFMGYIYSIRVYNRNLTETEILNNQKVDNKRFK